MWEQHDASKSRASSDAPGHGGARALSNSSNRRDATNTTSVKTNAGSSSVNSHFGPSSKNSTRPQDVSSTKTSTSAVQTTPRLPSTASGASRSQLSLSAPIFGEGNDEAFKLISHQMTKVEVCRQELEKYQRKVGLAIANFGIWANRS